MSARPLRSPALALGALALGALAGPLAAQGKAPKSGAAASDRGVFLTLLGRDTVMVERFTRSGDRLEGEVLARSPRVRRIHFTATLAPDGRVTRYESEGRGPQPARAVVDVAGDSARIQLVMGDSTRRYAMGGTAPLVPMPGTFAWSLFEQAIRATRGAPGAPGAAGDSIPFSIVVPGGREAMPSWVRPLRGADSVAVGFFGLPAYAVLDQQGRLVRWNGMATTDKVMVRRVAALDLDRLAAAWTAAEQGGHALGQLSPRDTVRATVGGAELAIDYGRPRMRGRTIFGNVVPLDTVWRLGANAATGFTTSKDLVVGGVPVPAGSYTLFALPRASGAKLVVSKATGEWGTDYDPARDLARIDMEQRKTASPVEQFTIGILPATAGPGGTGGVLRFAWADREWRVPFTVK
ncbi:MAG TPA: DUF2911 domain-containing protein [Gemmatimonadales bacterium]|nr:DUF2911 domain-containing protein [Gemmatimonadales bacterium]